MRADRLLALLMYLQNRGRTTSDRLARELEVSQRTILRDLYALRVAGFPVYTERGPAGGIYLHEEFRMRLTDLTHEELAALFTLGVPAQLADLGLSAEAKGALLKLAASQPGSRNTVDREVRRRIYLDPEPWNKQRESHPTLSTLRQALWNDVWVRAVLLRVGLFRTEHEMAPLGLVAKGRSWYVIWHGRDLGIRVDRASVVLEAELLEERFDRPEDFDIVEFWSTWAPAYQAAAVAYPVSARLRPSAIEKLQEQFVTQLPMDEPVEDNGEWVRVALRFESLNQAREMFLVLGNAAQVIEPEALRLSIEDYARQTMQLYASS